MKAEALLALYERVADAPDAIARLRRFVLDLAVRGKLVEQECSNEVRSEIGALSNRRPSVIGDFDPPFSAPPAWTWNSIGAASELVTDGEHSTPPRIDARDVPLVTAKNVRDGFMDYSQTDWVAKETAEKAWRRCQPQLNDLLMVCVGATTGRLAVLRESREMVLVRSVALIRPGQSLAPDYLELAIRSPLAQTQIWASVKVSAQPCLYIKRIKALHIPVPPLAEQHRIVAKVDELMALLDRLDAARSAREATRDRLTTASLTRLAAPDTPTETLRTHARFALDALPALTARADQIKQLRQTILNLAVRGQLVAQEAVESEAQPRSKSIPETEAPFAVPAGWRWVRLRDLGTLKGGGTPSKTRDDFWSGSIPWVSPKDMKVDVILHAQMSISEAAVSATAVHLIPARSVLFVVRGMILAHSFPVAISGVELTINQDMKALVLKASVTPEYMLMTLRGLKPEMLARVQRSTHGTCRLEGSDYADFPVPVPPLAEQHRIVAKVNELMALCDRLEAALQAADSTRARLLESLLHEALGNPATELAA